MEKGAKTTPFKLGFFVHQGQVVVAMPEPYQYLYLPPDMAENAARAILALVAELRSKRVAE